jgi:hypothetical protein
MTAQQAAFARIAAREEEILVARLFPKRFTAKALTRALGLRRLNMESATRRSLVGAKGMR